MVDARSRTKVFLDTHLVGAVAAAITKNDGATLALFHVQYAKPPYHAPRVFLGGKDYDAVFNVEQADSKAITDHNGDVIAYAEKVPIIIECTDKTGIDGNTLLGKCEDALRAIIEAQFLWVSFRSFNHMSKQTKDMGGWILYSSEWNLTYERECDSAHTSGVTLSYGQAFMEDFQTMWAPIIYTATGGTTTTIVNTSHMEVNDYWNGKWFKMLTGTCAGQFRKCIDFTTADDTVTVDGAFPFTDTIDAGDTYVVSFWSATEDGNVITPSIADQDFMSLTIGTSAGNKIAYISYHNEATTTDNLGLFSTSYPQFRYRYKTSDTSIKAKIVLVFSTWNYGLTEAQNLAAGAGQLVLDATSATTLTVGVATITTAKTVDHVRLYANTATGTVYYDFAMIYTGDFAVPNCRYGKTPKFTSKEAELSIFGMSGDLSQGGGSKLLEVTHGCDLTKGTWKRTLPTDQVAGEVFHDIIHNGKSEPWQWYGSSIYPNMKCRLVDLDMPTQASENQLDWRLNFTIREKRVSDAGISAETTRTRWGHNET